MSSILSSQKLTCLFRVTGWLEGTSFLLLLFVGMPLKYMWQDPIVVKTLGMPHGILFVIYIFFSHIIAEELNWPLKIRLFAFIAAVVPFGTFIFERKYLVKNL